MIDTDKIRCSILTLAFSGKLTEQLESDGNASQLAERISPNKNIVIDNNIPYSIPKNWCWIRLSDAYKVNPHVDANQSTNAGFVPMEKISAGFCRNFSYDTQPWEQASKNHTKFSNGDVAFAKISPCFENRKSFIANGLPNGIGGGTTELIVLRQPLIYSQYTYYLVVDQRFIKAGSESYRGIVGQQRVKPEVIKNYPIPLPPYEEQKRIVEHVDKAFAILEKIDAVQAEYADNLEALKEKVVEAAMHGQLTEQLSSDSSIIEHLKRYLVFPSHNENYNDIPDSWCCVQLSKICDLDTGNSIPEAVKKEKYQGYNGGYPYIGTKDVGFDHIVDYENGVRIPFNEPKFIIAENTSVLLCIEGGSAGRKIAIVNQEVCYGNKLCKFYTTIINPRYIYYFLQSYSFKKLFKNKVTGLIGGVSISTLRKLTIPVPPIEEQQRIVERLDNMLSVFESMTVK